MNEIMYQKSYQEYKAELDAELTKSAESFVKIGYLLKVARDTNILAESGYKSVADFAEAEYSLNKTQVSRFISINDKFSENGYSERLQEQYRGYGYAKLTIMLQIPTEIAEELTPDFSKTEIQTLKEEIDEEKKVSDIEVMMEGQRKDQADMTILERVVHQLGETDYELFKQIFDAMKARALAMDDIKRILAPAGEKIYSVRIMGMGRCILSLKDSEEKVSVTPVRYPEDKEHFTWDELISAWYMLFGMVEADRVDEAYEAVYDKGYPLKVEVAPVQQPKEEEKKPAPKKESKISKAKEPKKPEKTECEADSEEEEQIPGQMTVTDYPELIPETTFEEVKDVVSNADEEGEPGTGDIDGMSGGAGTDRDANMPRFIPEPAGEEVLSDNESAGTAEIGGREDHYESEIDIWYRASRAHSKLHTAFSVYGTPPKDKEILNSLYEEAINLAAALEKLKMEE